MRTCLFVSAVTSFISYLGVDAVHMSNADLSMHDAYDSVAPWDGSTLCQTDRAEIDGNKILLDLTFGTIKYGAKGTAMASKYVYNDLGVKNALRDVHVSNPFKAAGLYRDKKYEFKDLYQKDLLEMGLLCKKIGESIMLMKEKSGDSFGAMLNSISDSRNKERWN